MKTIQDKTLREIRQDRRETKPSNPLQWKLLGYAGVDAGLLMVSDPCYSVGGNEMGDTWTEFLERQSLLGPENDKHQILNKNGAEVGVVAGTAYGDGCYPVFGLMGPRMEGGPDVCHAMLVCTGDYENGIPELPAPICP